MRQTLMESPKSQDLMGTLFELLEMNWDLLRETQHRCLMSSADQICEDVRTATAYSQVDVVDPLGYPEWHALNRGQLQPEPPSDVPEHAD